MILKKAKRKRVRLKIGIASAAGGGKTLGSLLLAYGIVRNMYPEISDEEVWDKIAMIDTENGSGELYSDRVKEGVHIGEYGVVTLEPPYESKKYIEAINLCKQSGIEVIIVDSLTHLWSGEGGALDKQANIAKRTGNGFTSWKEPKKEFRSVIDKILQTDAHFIVTMRSKADYVQEKDGNGRTSIRKVGMNPIVMDGVDYEFSVVFDIDTEHVATASKDRTGLFDGRYMKLSPDVGKSLIDWVNESPEKSEPAKIINEVNTVSLEDLIFEIKSLFAQKIEEGKDKEYLYSIVTKYHNSKNFTTLKDVDAAKKIIEEIKGV